MIPFLTFITILSLTIKAMLTDFATSVIPGWHITIFPPYSVGIFSIIISVFLGTLGYGYYFKKSIKIKLLVFVIHLLLILPLIICISLPVLIFDLLFFNHLNDAINNVELFQSFILLLIILFVIGKILFVYYFMKTKKK